MLLLPTIPSLAGSPPREGCTNQLTRGGGEGMRSLMRA